MKRGGAESARLHFLRALCVYTFRIRPIISRMALAAGSTGDVHVRVDLESLRHIDIAQVTVFSGT